MKHVFAATVALAGIIGVTAAPAARADTIIDVNFDSVDVGNSYVVGPVPLSYLASFGITLSTSYNDLQPSIISYSYTDSFTPVSAPNFFDVYGGGVRFHLQPKFLDTRRLA